MIKPAAFTGQGSKKQRKGQNQRQQHQVVKAFKNGDFNTLVATSIGEEGLDIGQVTDTYREERGWPLAVGRWPSAVG